MNDNRLLFDGLVIFCAVVENQGFTAAARVLGHTPSHVSKEIARLEKRLGVRLLNRTTRSVSLTEEGKSFYEDTRQIVEDARRAERRVLSSSGKPSGLLKVSAPVSFSHSRLNRWLPEFLEAYPDIRLEIHSSEHMVDIVAEGFDVVVRAGQLEDSGFVARKLAVSRRIIAASPQYLARAGTPRSPEDLNNHVLIDFSQRRLPGVWEFAGIDGRRTPVQVVPRVVCNSAETEEALAVAGVGITRLPEFACSDSIASGELVPILEDYEEDPVGLYAIYPSRSQLASKVRVFVDFLANKMGRGF